VVTLGTGGARGQSRAFVAMDGEFRIEWEQRQTSRGPAIAGYVWNDSGMPAARVAVLVEGLDGTGGRVVNTTIGYVVGVVPGFGRTPFEVRVPSAASYRLRISSYDWLKGGAGGGGM